MMASGGIHLWMCMVTIGSVAAYLLHEKSGYNFQPATKMKAFIKSEGFKSGLPDVVSNIDGLAVLTQLDSVPPGEVITTVVDSLLPLIATGLALIPGGALIGGIITGVWGIMSALFGTPRKSPMELAIDGIKNEIKELKAHVKKLGEEIKESTRKQTEARLSSIIQRAINGEITRNKYICNKYAIISRDFIKDMRNNRTIGESRRIEIIASIHNCDNFLRDTVDAFVYKEFADVLWIPSVFVTMLRISFLTEAINYGMSLQLDKPIIAMFWEEVKSDIKRHFEFALDGMEGRMVSMNASERKSEHFYVPRDDFLPSETNACKIQGQLLYIDREIYPYGVPEQFVISDSDTELKISYFNVTNTDDPHHIQIFPNKIKNIDSDDFDHKALLNCIMGPTLIRLTGRKLSFPVTYVRNKSYQLRVLYFSKISTYTCYKPGFNIQKNSDWRLGVHQEFGNNIIVSLNKGKPNENNPQRFLWKTGYHEMTCLLKDDLGNSICNPSCILNSGYFVVENVATFNIVSEEQTKGRISIVVDDHRINNVNIFGAELIMLPIIQ